MMYLFYKMGRWVSLTLPFGISYRIADILGSLYYFLARRDKKIAASNIKVVLNGAGNVHQIRHLSRMVFVNFARYLVEFFRTPKIDLKYIEKHIKIEGRENLDNALKLGKGVLLVSAHLGNWELGAIVLSMLGYPLNIIVWKHKNRLINDFFVQQRQSKGLKVIPLGITIRKAFSALRHNEMVALLGDIDYLQPEAGISVKFFGRNTIMPKGPALFSLKTGAPIVPVFLLREKGKSFRYVVEKPIMSGPLRNKEEDLSRLTQKIAQVIEVYIARNPGQWFMLRQRWQTDGAKKEEKA